MKRERFNNNTQGDGWTKGRVSPHGTNWAEKYAQKDFSRQLKQPFIKRLINILTRRKMK